MDTEPARRIISNMQKLQLPSERPEKPKTGGMMARKGNFTPVDEKEDTPPTIRAKEIVMAIRKQNKKRNGLNETA
tara:strand:- start:672 stop:896 length:225 start_codon:yes stop_codon:yes gene_type:complete